MKARRMGRKVTYLRNLMLLRHHLAANRCLLVVQSSSAALLYMRAVPETYPKTASPDAPGSITVTLCE